jgi:hypothetical protein
MVPLKAAQSGHPATDGCGSASKAKDEHSRRRIVKAETTVLFIVTLGDM